MVVVEQDDEMGNDEEILHTEEEQQEYAPVMTDEEVENDLDQLVDEQFYQVGPNQGAIAEIDALEADMAAIDALSQDASSQGQGGPVEVAHEDIMHVAEGEDHPEPVSAQDEDAVEEEAAADQPAESEDNFTANFNDDDEEEEAEQPEMQAEEAHESEYSEISQHELKPM